MLRSCLARSPLHRSMEMSATCCLCCSCDYYYYNWWRRHPEIPSPGRHPGASQGAGQGEAKWSLATAGCHLPSLRKGRRRSRVLGIRACLDRTRKLSLAPAPAEARKAALRGAESTNTGVPDRPLPCWAHPHPRSLLPLTCKTEVTGLTCQGC